MVEIIGVKFKSSGKLYYFAPGDLNPAEGTYVVVETARGPECGEVAARRHAVSEDSITAPLKPILRIATDADLEILEKNRAFMKEALQFCEQCIEARELPMRLVDVECGFDSNKLIFYFTAESRVDFRELVKDLAQQFHMRIELRQIGDRDETKLLGGLGICGREFCCKGYLSNFQPISIKMAKEQGLALNPTKISGACGRLMCCLRYESPVYEELIKLTPKVGSTVLLPGDPPIRAYVMEANLVTGNLRVKPENADTPVTVSRDSVERLQDASRRMTKEDLREKREPSAVPVQPVKAKKEKPEKAEKTEKAEKPEKAAAEKTEAKPEKPQKPARQPRPAKPHPERAERQERAERPERPERTERRAEPSGAAALRPEFGENRQQRNAPAERPQVQRRSAAPMLDDFTEHRAVVEHPERVRPAENGTSGSGEEHRRRFRRSRPHPGGQRPPKQSEGGHSES
ncbi:MAG: stage 0 sporulation protein [Oscillospiraceae bacterium]|nr:stage 0 sporulation protein [Oscillospiraceae bacterium]